jgi:hypothetical protein
LGGLQDILLEETVCLKNPAFSDEREWRVVVRRREFTKQGTDDGGRTPIPIYFRSSHGMLVPYIKLVPIESSKKLPIESVTTGPTFDRFGAKMAVSMLLNKNAFGSVDVRTSEIPVRP